MKFPNQILAEAKNMLRSKFILISMILAFIAITAGVPVFGAIVDKLQDDRYESYYSYNENLVVDGVTIDPDNEFYWEIQNCVDQRDHLTDWFDDELGSEYALGLNDELLAFYLKYAPDITPSSYENGYYQSDYRAQLMYSMRDYITNAFVLGLIADGAEQPTVQMAVEAVSYTDVERLYKMTDEEKQNYLDDAKLNLDDFADLMENSNFLKYVEIQMRNYEQNIEDNLARLETLEADIIKNPDQEEYIADEIESLERQNKEIQESYIPELEYRAEHGIVVNDGSWQDLAMNSTSSAKNTIRRATDFKMTKEEFEEDQWSKREYGNYTNYEKSLENEIRQAQEDIFVAESSLNNDAPDMSFVAKGARQNLYNMFSLSMLVVLFGALIGGWCIASEFQGGTVRLLMIRPRTRLKILFSRYFAGLALTYVLYFVAFVVTAIVQGAMYGFGDYFLPNYTASGEVNFFLMWIRDFFAVSMSFVFIYSVSFAMSAIIKNIAVSVIIPTLVLIGSVVAMSFFSAAEPVSIIAYTPIPYLTMYDFFGHQYTPLNQLVTKGVPVSIALGTVVLLVCSALMMALACAIFKKKDITN